MSLLEKIINNSNEYEPTVEMEKTKSEDNSEMMQTGMFQLH